MLSGTILIFNYKFEEIDLAMPEFVQLCEREIALQKNETSSGNPLTWPVKKSPGKKPRLGTTRGRRSDALSHLVRGDLMREHS